MDPQRPRVLIVDDEPDVLESFRMIIEDDLPHVDVVATVSPSEALDLARTCPFDLALSDYMMPEMDGIEFLVRFHRQCPAARTVLVTAFWNPALSAEAARITAITQVLGKPLEPDELIRTVAALTRSDPTSSVPASGHPQ